MNEQVLNLIGGALFVFFPVASLAIIAGSTAGSVFQAVGRRVGPERRCPYCNGPTWNSASVCRHCAREIGAIEKEESKR